MRRSGSKSVARSASLRCGSQSPARNPLSASIAEPSSERAASRTSCRSERRVIVERGTSQSSSAPTGAGHAHRSIAMRKANRFMRLAAIAFRRRSNQASRSRSVSAARSNTRAFVACPGIPSNGFLPFSPGIYPSAVHCRGKSAESSIGNQLEVPPAVAVPSVSNQLELLLWYLYHIRDALRSLASQNTSNSHVPTQSIVAAKF